MHYNPVIAYEYRNLVYATTLISKKFLSAVEVTNKCVIMILGVQQN